MATVTKTIGTTGRDYSTITAWEADLDNATYYAAGDNAVGECYKDSQFDERVVIDGGGTIGLASVRLTAGAGQKHTGVAGTGVILRFSPTTGSNVLTFTRNYTTIEDIEIIADVDVSYVGTVVTGSYLSNKYCRVQRCIIHRGTGANSLFRCVIMGDYPTDSYLQNCIMYGVTATGANAKTADLPAANASNYLRVHNCVVYGSASYGFGSAYTGAFNRLRNCYAGGNANGDYQGSAFDTANSDYNISSDLTAIGVHKKTSIAGSAMFVSTVAGSEDFHLKSTATDAFGYSTQTGIDATAGKYDIDGNPRDAAPTGQTRAWDCGADQHGQEWVTTVGTTGRYYSTITAWEADLDNAAVYIKGDSAVASCYNDSVFSEYVLVNGGGTVGLTGRKVTAPVGQRHTGVAGTGVRIQCPSTTGAFAVVSGYPITIEWLEIFNYGGTGNTVSAITADCPGSIVRHNIIHDRRSNNQGACIKFNTNGVAVVGNIVYNGYYGVRDQGTAGGTIYCNTAYNILQTAFGKNASYAVDDCRDNIAIGGGIGFGSNWGMANNNISSDASAPGTGSLTNVAVGTQFVSTMAGSEDLHLSEYSDAIHAGTSNGAVYEANIDIDSDDRLAYPSGYRTWDVGADQRGETIETSIGTAARTYSTISAWAADLISNAKYISDDQPVGRCYNDSVFNESVVIAGAPRYATPLLTVDESQRHDGIEGVGVRLTSPGGYGIVPLVSCVIEDLEIYGWGSGVGMGMSAIDTTGVLPAGYGCKISRCLMHDEVTGNYGPAVFSGENDVVQNCFVYNTTTGIIDLNGAWYHVYMNNTIYHTGYSGIVSLFGATGQYINAINNLVMDCDGEGWGGKCFDYTNQVLLSRNNESSDDTADDVGIQSIIDAVPADEIISTTPGAFDLHLKVGAQAQNNGDYLTYDDVNIDVNYFDRGTNAWDIGAHEIEDDMAVTAVDPDSGTILGGSNVQVFGTFFQHGCEVWFGDRQATDVDFITSRRLYCKTPAFWAANQVDVKVVNPDMTEATGTDLYQYLAVPSPVPKVVSGGRSRSAPFNGAKLLGDTGADEVGAYPWFEIKEQASGMLQFRLRGSLADDIEISIQACLAGGKSRPKTIATVNHVSGDVKLEMNGAYDLVRAVVTKYAQAAEHSQVLLSGRVRTRISSGSGPGEGPGPT